MVVARALKGMASVRPSPGRSRRLHNRALALGALVLVAGGIAAIVAFVGSSDTKPLNSPLRNQAPTDVSKVPKSVKLSESAAQVAQRFLATNVIREHLADGYKLVGPDLKEGMTLKQWLTGNIPVVPYPGDVIGKVPIQILYSYPREAVLKVYLLPKKGLHIRAGSFYLTLRLYGHGGRARWLVDGWVPYAQIAVPSIGRSN
jgi:hypothetical protein